jgi:ABC-type multidrug transport system fused ATPase/permease subunit
MHILKRLFRLLVPYRTTLAVSVVLLLTRAGIELLPPLFQRRIIDGVIGSRDLDRLGGAVAALVGIYALQQGLSAIDVYVRHALGERFIFDLRVRLYDYLQRLSLSFFGSTSTGELMSRVTNDVNALEHFVTHGSAFMAVAVVRLVGAMAVLFWLNWRLALWSLIPVPILAVALRAFNERVRPIYRRTRDRLGDIHARLQDSLAGIQVVQAFGQEERERSRFSAESESYYRERIRGMRYWSSFFPSMGFVATIGTVAALGGGAQMVVRGELSIGTLVAFLSYIQSLYAPIHTLVEVDNVLQQAIASGERIFELLDQRSEIVDGPDAQDVRMEGHVAFHDVHFAYPDRAYLRQDALLSESSKGPEVLGDVTFEIEPGQMVALVGPSGAGKTSIANLLCRFYDPQDGWVAVDGVDLRQIALASLRSQVGVVLQDTFLFNATVRENLLYGKPGASDEELVAAAKTAYAHDFILGLPKGYDTEIGERGVRLSGGQKQRLALARAILVDPRILILDEATSSVDAEAEYLIQQALEAVLRGRTSLVIAHRLSTVRNADKIIALEEGRILEIGDHQALMERGGLYSQLYRRQLELGGQEPF